MNAENILIEIAQENGFDTWEQYFECFRTTDAGRRVINKGILKAVNQSLILSNVVGRSEQLVCDKKCEWTRYPKDGVWYDGCVKCGKEVAN